MGTEIEAEAKMETLFAEVKDGIVLRVIVVDPKDAPTEAKGAEFCKKLLGGDWKQTYYDSSKRKHYAGIGYTFDKTRDAFYAKTPYPSWNLDDDCNWQAPVSRPKDDKDYSWDEDKQEWAEQTEEPSPVAK